ncbi:sulfurtransferase [Alteromonas pelagimontana]|uniref:Sulfurtransferase n=1 Tax=Alteromonas pelagimontana TaxID=1858656 RepID=A0A6M4MI22_9ALTE|nr:sulfurtransferase [Alteromonas pelagimontana]QJR79314.1 sulfurtransferase [Alteromonas pelagimontana]QJR82672.1 sulfurtransferase [Alteromonas pelagimontana]
MKTALISVAELQQALVQEPLMILRALMKDPINGTADNHQSDFLPNTFNFDIDSEGSDPSSSLPHTFPGVDTLALHLGHIGLSIDTPVVVYDNHGIYSAPRVWWLLKALGHKNVKILDGGLPAWKAAALPINPGSAVPGHNRFYEPQPEADWFVGAGEVEASLGSATQIVDARSRDRFSGKVPEPRAGVRRGHIPGSYNVPFTELLKNQRFKKVRTLKDAFAQAGVDLSKPIICSCGSGVTACIAGVAALLSGATVVSVYDGSWAEWGANTQYPVEV